MKLMNKNRKILLSALLIIVVEIFTPKVLATEVKESDALKLLNRFTLSDINQLYQSCGNADSTTKGCAIVADKIMQIHFKKTKPITSEDVQLFWKDCYDTGDNKLCAHNLTFLLKKHMPSNTDYTVSEKDVSEVKSTGLISQNADYSTLINQVDDFFKSE